MPLTLVDGPGDELTKRRRQQSQADPFLTAPVDLSYTWQEVRDILYICNVPEELALDVLDNWPPPRAV